MDKELLYNQSGIKDITAYKAINNLRKRGTEDMNGYEINQGEVWEVESGAGTKMVVILACFDRYAATIMLQEQEPASNAVPVRVRDIMYADAGRLGYIFYDKIVDFVRALSADEEIELRQAIGAALELGAINQEQATRAVEFQEAATEAATAKLDAARKEIEILRKELAEAGSKAVSAQEEAAEFALRLEASRAEVDVLRRNMESQEKTIERAEDNGLREDLAAARKEAEIYKGLYENMLARALG